MDIRKIINSYLDQHIIAFHSGAIGGLNRGGNEIARFRRSNPESPPPEKALKVLIAVPSQAVNNPGMKEVSHAYRTFSKAGYKVDFVTADGSPVQFSKSDLTDSVNRWFVEDKNASYSADQPLKVKDVMPSRYAGAYFAGCNEIVTESHWFQSLALEILKNGGVVAGSGDAEAAVDSLGLASYVESDYSLPKSNSLNSVTDYGSAAAEAVKIEASWMIHKNELISSNADDISKLGERVVMQLAS